MGRSLDRAGFVPRGYLHNLTLSTAGSSATFSIALGQAVDSAFIDILTLPSAYTKTTGSWVVGSGNGALDTDTIAINSWYHAYVIKRLDTGVVDVLISLSATAPTLPSPYTLSRRIGSMKTDGSSQWVAFTQVGDRFRWSVPVLDINNVSLSASYVSRALTTPLGVQCVAFGNAVAGIGGSIINIRPVGAADATMAAGSASFTATPLGTIGSFATGASPVSASAQWRELTDTFSQISLSGNSTVGTYLTTVGWEDTRGKLS